ncbi:NUDIX hydrolase [Streptomyces sp. NPDC049813]|uniref:NUDIX hydrolase n=1 Tax=Streptomyces sp. NPDC049813 TaxID=3365597 RepID=UPI00378BF66F
MNERVERVDEHDRVLAVVSRSDAVRHRWPHRVATVVCRDTQGRTLVHRRPPSASRFPGHLNWMLGGAVGVGESYEAAAARELTKELGVLSTPAPLFKFLCAGVLGPYWLGLHETVVTGRIAPDPAEIAWHAWLTESELRALVRHEAFVPDAREAFDRYCALRPRPPRP